MKVLYEWGRGVKIDPRKELRYDIIKYSYDILSSQLEFLFTDDQY